MEWARQKLRPRPRVGAHACWRHQVVRPTPSGTPALGQAPAPTATGRSVTRQLRPPSRSRRLRFGVPVEPVEADADADSPRPPARRNRTGCRPRTAGSSALAVGLLDPSGQRKCRPRVLARRRPVPPVTPPAATPARPPSGRCPSGSAPPRGGRRGREGLRLGFGGCGAQRRRSLRRELLPGGDLRRGAGRRSPRGSTPVISAMNSASTRITRTWPTHDPPVLLPGDHTTSAAPALAPASR